jgi:hypothetical protein
MSKYDYEMVMNADIRDYIRENYTEDEMREKLEDRDEWEMELNDDMWISDGVTGNASGSYTFNTWTAREYVTDNTETLQEALREFCEDAESIAEHFLNDDWEYFDVTIRCYLLGQVLHSVLDEIEEEMEEGATV